MYFVLAPSIECIRPEQVDVETAAKRVPIGIQGFPLDHQHRLYGAMELLEALAVDEYLAQTEPQLSLFVSRGEALDLGYPSFPAVEPKKIPRRV